MRTPRRGSGGGIRALSAGRVAGALGAAALLGITPMTPAPPAQADWDWAIDLVAPMAAVDTTEPGLDLGSLMELAQTWVDQLDPASNAFFSTTIDAVLALPGPGRPLTPPRGWTSSSTRRCTPACRNGSPARSESSAST